VPLVLGAASMAWNGPELDDCFARTRDDSAHRAGAGRMPVQIGTTGQAPVTTCVVELGASGDVLVAHGVG